MDILGIGLPELGLILVIILLVLGPKDMVNTSRRIARTIRMLTRSEFWRTTREAWKMAQELPNELLRESGLDETRAEMDRMNRDLDQWKRENDSTYQALTSANQPEHAPSVQDPPPGDLEGSEEKKRDSHEDQPLSSDE